MALSLRINIIEKSVTKTLQFDPSTNIFDACKVIREKCSELPDLGQPKDYGLFLAGEVYGSGAWLEPGKTLDYYLLRNGDTIEYRRKMRILKVRTLDGAHKTMQVDDSQNVTNLMVVICTKMGITNHDEYSLVRELLDENDIMNRSDNYGTLTLRRKKEEREKDVKMEQLRKKLKTDDEMNWVDHTKTLREQGIEEHEVLLLRRKFFFSDQNIDAHDPVQLNLLYVQARDAILDVTHPVTQDKACEFAGIQCQIQFGDYIPAKHRPGFLDLKDLVPASYVKVKGIEKKIYLEHRKHIGMTEVDAKALYTKTARSLDTYGVTFFLVKEKMPGKNKLVPRLLGVTKDSVLRLDERTKEILKTWPLTTVRRWAASPNTFTLDFGDYSDQYYSVQTPEGEQIAQLIAGYIDIILKKKQAKDHLGIDGDEGSTLVEEIVSPFQATTMQRQPSNKATPIVTDSVAKPAVIQAGPEGINQIHTGHLQSAQYTTLRGSLDVAHSPQPSIQRIQETETMSRIQRSLLTGREAVAGAEKYLDTPFNLPPLGNDPASQKWKTTQITSKRSNVQTQISAMNASVAHMVTTSDEHDSSNNILDETTTALSSGLPEVAKDVRMLAALMDDSTGDKLITATRKLCSAFSELLNTAEPGGGGSNKEPRQSLLSAAGRVGDASRALLNTIEEGDEAQDVLLVLAKGVANSAAKLVVQAKQCASTVEEIQQKEEIISAAATTALCASELVACAKVVAPTINNDRCRGELMGATRRVAQAVESVLSACNNSTADKGRKVDLQSAAREVSDSLNRLLDHIRPVSRHSVHENLQEGAVDTILVATDKIMTSEDSGDMVRQARILAQATAQLINAIKGEAEKTPDSELQRKLIAAAKVLAEATSKLVEAAKSCASNPNQSSSQELLRQAAQDLRDATNVAADGAVQRKGLRRLESSAKNAASAAAQCIASSQSASPHCPNSTTREAMSQDCRAVADTIPELVSAVKSSLQSTDESCQLNLMEAADKFLEPSLSLVSTAKNACSFIVDPATSRHLTTTSQKLAVELVELRTSVDRMRADSGLNNQPRRQIESAAGKIREIKEEIIGCRRVAGRGELRPLPGDNSTNSVQKLMSSIRKVQTCTEQLVNSVCTADSASATSSAQGLASNLSHLVHSARAVAATTSGDPVRVLSATEETLERCWILLRESSGIIGSNVGEQEREIALSPLSKSVHDSLIKLQSSIPGQTEIEDGIQAINSCQFEVNPRSSKNYGQLQSELQFISQQVSESALNIVGSTSDPGELGRESSNFSTNTVKLIKTGQQLAGLQEDNVLRDEILITLKNVSIVTSNLLLVAKNVTSSSGESRNQLNSAARAVSETLNSLINVCSSAAPGQKECDNAVRRIQALKSLLVNPSEPLNNSSYFDCQSIVVEKSKQLGDSMTGIANYAKEGKLDEFGVSVNLAADAVCGLVESSAQAAYLLGAGDPTSISGRPGLIDIHSINQSTVNIKSACSILSNPNVNQQQVLNAATTIAKHTSSLCNACRTAADRSNDATTKRQFVQMAKDVANSTAGLVQEIKDSERNNVGPASQQLIKAVNSLVNYASQPEFGSISAKISSKGRLTQEPIVSSGKNVIEGSCLMLQAAKSLAINPKDPPIWQQLALHSKQVSDSIKKLVTGLREKAPGQSQCEISLQKLNDLLKQLNQASLNAVSSNLGQRKDNSISGFVQNAENGLRTAEEFIEPLRRAGRAEAENLGHQVNSIVAVIEALVGNIIGAASCILETKEQVNLLERSKTVLESAIQFVSAGKDSGGNPRAVTLHSELDLSAQCFQEGLDDLKVSLERISSGAGGLVASITDSIAASMVKLDQQNFVASGNETFVDFQTRMVTACKEIARLSQEIVSKSTQDVNQIPQLSSDLSHHYIQLAGDARGGISTTSSPDIGIRLRCGVQELGRAVIDLVRCGGSVQFSPNDSFAIRDLSDSNRIVSEKVADILGALQAGSRGTQACINAACTVSGIIGDLDTTIMFATAGTLHSETGENFGDHRENIIKTAKAVVQDTKTLVAGAASTQEQLALAASSAVSTIVQLSEAVKFGAASLGSNNPESQVMLINSVRDVAAALHDLILSTKSAAGKGSSDASMIQLKESAKIMVTNVTSLLKTVKAVEDEHTRGTRALEATIEAIAQEIRAFDSGDPPRGRPVTAEELVRSTKPVTSATARAVASGSSLRQDDVIVAANTGRKVISDILTASKSAAYTLEGENRERLLQAAKLVGLHYRELLTFVLHGVNQPSADVKQQLSQCSREIASAVTEIVAVGQIMKVVQNQASTNPLFGQSLRTETHLQGNEFADPDDPTVIAENELLGAANSIDAAAKKLEKLRPRRSIRETDESLNFDEMILEAAKSIACATSALVKAASFAQRELVDSGRVSRKITSDSDDGQWAEGLVSAAQMVAAATHSLVESANLLVQGHATEEKLISAAKQVASSTAQLLVACKVKASPDSDGTRRLQAAGNAVIRSTDNLVRAARQALSQEEEHQLVLHQKKVGSIAQVIDARAEVLRIERELEEARKKLAVIHKAKYHGETQGGYNPDDSDVEYLDNLKTDSRLDNLLESSNERINSASNSFNIMRIGQQNSQQQLNQSTNYPTAAAGLKPAVSPKPSASIIDRKYQQSPTSTISRESSSGPPQPPARSFQTGSIGVPSPSPSDDLYSRAAPPNNRQETTKLFMKPSEFLVTKSGQQAPVVPPHQFGNIQQRKGQDDVTTQEFSTFDSGPVTEQVLESTNADGSISLKRIFQQQQSSSSSKVTSTRKFFTQQQQQQNQ